MQPTYPYNDPWLDDGDPFAVEPLSPLPAPIPPGGPDPAQAPGQFLQPPAPAVAPFVGPPLPGDMRTEIEPGIVGPPAPAPDDAFDVTQDENYINPRHALWGGILQDLGQWLGSNGRSPLRGLGFQYMQSAAKNNRGIRQEAYRRDETARRTDIAEARERRAADAQMLTTDIKNWEYYRANGGTLPFGEWLQDSGSMATDGGIGKLDPSQYTPESLAAYMASGTGQADRDYSLLQRRDPDLSGTMAEYQEWLRDPRNEGKPIREFYKDRNYVKKEGSTLGGLDTTQRNNVLVGGNTMLESNNRAIQELRELRDELAGLDTGRIEGRVRPYFEAQYQAVRSNIMQQALQNIATLSNMGVRLNPITENELRILLSTMPEMTNEPEANVAIIDRQVKRLERLNNDIQKQIDFARNTNRPMSDYEVEPYDWRDAGAAQPAARPTRAGGRPTIEVIGPVPVEE